MASVLKDASMLQDTEDSAITSVFQTETRRKNERENEGILLDDSAPFK